MKLIPAQQIFNFNFSLFNFSFFKKGRKYPTYLFLLICLNLIIAPALYAANSETLGRSQAYALGILGIATVSFSIYLFLVMFQPEKF